MGKFQLVDDGICKTFLSGDLGLDGSPIAVIFLNISSNVFSWLLVFKSNLKKFTFSANLRDTFWFAIATSLNQNIRNSFI